MTDEPPSFRSLGRDERRGRILRAAKQVILEKGLEEASMDDVAARAGATKPTVYAHFKSKDALFVAVIEYIKGLLAGKLLSPDAYAVEPVEAVARFCGRFLALMSMRDPVRFQRIAVTAGARAPAIARTVYTNLFAEARRSLAAYLHGHRLTREPERDAELLLAATTAGAVLRLLFGVDDPSEEHPEDAVIGGQIDLEGIRRAVKLCAAGWDPERPSGGGSGTSTGAADEPGG